MGAESFSFLRVAFTKYQETFSSYLMQPTATGERHVVPHFADKEAEAQEP